jgi:ABC-2 type transport system ATP-binding protein
MNDAGDLGRVVELLKPFACGDEVTEPGASMVSVPVHSADGLVPDVVRMLDREGLAVHDVGVRHVTLDDVFLALTGHAAEELEDEVPRAERKGAA